jgi:hypothetical protein
LLFRLLRLKLLLTLPLGLLGLELLLAKLFGLLLALCLELLLALLFRLLRLKLLLTLPLGLLGLELLLAKLFGLLLALRLELLLAKLFGLLLTLRLYLRRGLGMTLRVDAAS